MDDPTADRLARLIRVHESTPGYPNWQTARAVWEALDANGSGLYFLGGKAYFAAKDGTLYVGEVIDLDGVGESVKPSSPVPPSPATPTLERTTGHPAIDAAALRLIRDSGGNMGWDEAVETAWVQHLGTGYLGA